MEPIEEIKKIAETISDYMGYAGASVDYDAEKKRISVVMRGNNGEPIPLKEDIMDAFEVLFKQIARKHGLAPVFIDVNNYRSDRDKLIVELAKAAARKADLTKKEVALPPMNAYERRIVHTELATRPDVTTASEGEGPLRHIVVRPFE